MHAKLLLIFFWCNQQQTYALNANNAAMTCINLYNKSVIFNSCPQSKWSTNDPTNQKPSINKLNQNGSTEPNEKKNRCSVQLTQQKIQMIGSLIHFKIYVAMPYHRCCSKNPIEFADFFLSNGCHQKFQNMSIRRRRASTNDSFTHKTD